MINILLTSVGRRGHLVENLIKTLGDKGSVYVTDCSNNAPALYCGGKPIIVPRIDAPNYIDKLIEICKDNKIKVILTFIDPEIKLLAENRQRFTDEGVLPLIPSEETALLCFDKYKMFQFLKKNGINTVNSYVELDKFKEDEKQGKISFPVFIKPNTGSGSVGAQKVDTMEELELLITENKFSYIIQEYMQGVDCGADVYVDTINREAVSIFLKKKLECRIGGASKTVSFYDKKLVDFVKEIVQKFDFYGPIDMDFFCVNDKYYLSEINPRFGGGYLHAYGSQVDFFELIINNVNKISNEFIDNSALPETTMMMYDRAVVIPNIELC